MANQGIEPGVITIAVFAGSQDADATARLAVEAGIRGIKD
jgi:hypothetical protein